MRDVDESLRRLLKSDLSSLRGHQSYVVSMSVRSSGPRVFGSQRPRSAGGGASGSGAPAEGASWAVCIGASACGNPVCGSAMPSSLRRSCSIFAFKNAQT